MSLSDSDPCSAGSSKSTSTRQREMALIDLSVALSVVVLRPVRGSSTMPRLRTDRARPRTGERSADMVSMSGEGPDHTLVLRPNLSLSWRQAKIFLVVMAIVLVGLASGFAGAGLWPVLPLAGAEWLALASAFYLVQRRGHRMEVVSVRGGRVAVEKSSNPSRAARWDFPRGWVRVRLQPPASEGIRRDWCSRRKVRRSRWAIFWRKTNVGRRPSSFAGRSRGPDRKPPLTVIREQRIRWVQRIPARPAAPWRRTGQQVSQ